MATNAKSTADDDSTEVTAEDLRKAKYGQEEVETSEEADETSTDETADESTEETGDDDGQTDGQTTDETSEDDADADSADDDSEFVKEYPNIKGATLDDYARNLEAAYRNSTAEALRLKGELDKHGSEAVTPSQDKADSDVAVDLSNPMELWAKQAMDKEINDAFTNFSKSYTQVTEDGNYGRFTQTVAQLSRTILETEKRLASPRELYGKAAVILEWEPTNTVSDKEKLNIALKNRAAVAKTSSNTKTTGKSKVTDNMVAINRIMYPNKTDAEIREELEPYVK